MRTTRRGVLLAGAGGLGAVGAGVAASPEGRVRARALLGLTGDPGRVPDAAPARVERGRFASRLRGAETEWAVATPPGVDPDGLPVVVFLHGLGQSAATAFGALGLDRFLTASGAEVAIAAVDGGTSYWHRRPSGEDAGAMVLEELLPLLARRGLDTSRPALLGISMGGYAALRLGGMLGPSGCAAVGAMSPAIWRDPAAASRSGFDDAAEYERFTVFGRQRHLGGVPVRIDCGLADPFQPDVAAYADGLPHAEVSFTPGAHDRDYWLRVIPDQLAFVADRLR